MAVSCVPADLAENARCFVCNLSPGELESIKIYLLAVIAGGSLDPQTLATEAECFSCLTPGEAQNVELYLLCNIVNA